MTKKAKMRVLRRQMVWFTFLLPTILCLVVLTYVPTLQAVKYSFYDISVIGFEEEFIGLRNYTRILMDDTFLKSLVNTVILAALSLVVIPLGFLLAVAINSIRGKLQSVFRLGFYMPNIITGVCVILIFQSILQVDLGLLNQVLSAVTGESVQIPWLSSPALAKVGATIISLWSGIGYAMLINLAGLQSIPEEIYEAAMVDGARSHERLWYITVPSMSGSFVFLFITNVINSFSRFTDLFILSGNSANGRPYGALQTVLMFIYQNSFDNPAYGFACAGSIILFLIVMAVTLVNVRVTRYI